MSNFVLMRIAFCRGVYQGTVGQNQRLCNGVRPKFPRPGPQPFCLELRNYSEDVLVSKLSSREAEVQRLIFLPRHNFQLRG